MSVTKDKNKGKGVSGGGGGGGDSKPILRRAKLHQTFSIFNFPSTVLANLSLSPKHNRLLHTATTADSQTADKSEKAISVGDTAMLRALASARIAQPTCHTCGGEQFDSPEDQRLHFKSLWHRRNLTRKMEWRKRTPPPPPPPLDGVVSNGEYPWMPLARDDVDELEEEEEVGNDDGDDDGGGSDSESDMDAVNGSSDRVTVTAAAAAPRKRAGDGGDPKLSAGLLWFSANDGNSDNGDDDVTVYGVHRRILVPRGVHGVHVDAGQVLDELKGLQQPVAPQRTQAELKQQKKLLQQQGGGGGGQSTDESSSKGHSKQRLWAFVAMDGGYFAGAIIDTQTGDFVAHKTFVRYTTRRKQGGTQSRQDSAMGYAANSAGAQIRRYNEQKLQEEIHSLMEAWRAQLAVCDHILVRVPRTNRKDFFGPASVAATSHPLRWSDSRIREVPVPMARPSLAELRRVYAAVTTVSIAKVVRPATVADAAAAVAEQPKPDVAAGLLGDDGGCDSGSASDSTLEPEPRPDLLAFLHHVAKMIQDPALSDDDIVAYLCEHLEQFLDALSDPAMGLRYLTTTDSVQAFRTPTLLHVASLFGRADLISFLLDNGEDPTVTSGHPPLFAGGVTAFEIARDRRTRDEFRVYRSEHEGEIDGVDWSRARVPPPLTREQANEGEDRAKAKKRKDKERKKLRERRERRETEERGDQADNEAMDCAQEDIRRSQSRAVDSGVGKLSDAQLRARMLSSAYASAGSSWGLSSSSSSSSLSALASGVIPSSASPQRPVSPNTQRAIDRELRFQAIARRQQQEQQQQSPPRRPAAAAAAALATSTNSAARCTHCNKLLHGLVPFEMFDWQCCSLQCLHGHQALYGAPSS